MENDKNKRKLKNKSGLIFYCSMLILPVIQFCIFYIGVNINSVLMSFQTFDGGKYIFSGLSNFKQIYQDFTSSDLLLTALKNTVHVFGLTLIIEMFALFFSYYIYKEFIGSQFFKMVLFFPSIVSGVVLGIIYLNISDIVIPQIIYDVTGKEIIGLLGKQETRWGGNLVYWMLFYFGVRILVYTSNMDGISISISEAAKLDGVTPVDEFFKITLPLTFPSVSSFLIFAVAGIMTNGIGTYSLYGINAPNDLYTIGYFITSKTMMTTGLQDGYPFLAAFGILISCITIPLVYLARFLINRINEKIDV